MKGKHPWDKREYMRITEASYDGELLHVTFADGDEVAVLPQKLYMDTDAELCWHELRIHEFGWLRVPSAAGEIDIASDVVRLNTDDAYYEHMKAIGGAE